MEENQQTEVKTADLERCIPPTLVPEEPNDESCEAIREGDAFLASDKDGRFASGPDLIAVAMS